MSNTENTTSINFQLHTDAAEKVQRLRDMIVEEAEHLADPEGEILAQLTVVQQATHVMFGNRTRTH